MKLTLSIILLLFTPLMNASTLVFKNIDQHSELPLIHSVAKNQASLIHRPKEQTITLWLNELSEIF